MENRLSKKVTYIVIISIAVIIAVVMALNIVFYNKIFSIEPEITNASENISKELVITKLKTYVYGYEENSDVSLYDVLEFNDEAVNLSVVNIEIGNSKVFSPSYVIKVIDEVSVIFLKISLHNKSKDIVLYLVPKDQKISFIEKENEKANINNIINK